MDKRRLGQTEIMISPVGLGTVKFGRNEGVKYPQGFEIPAMDDLANLLEQAKALGVNMLDTAPAYGMSESRLGKLLQGQRKDWVIVGKVGEEFENGQSSHYFTPEHFKMSVDRSLKRLDTDRLDVLLVHSDGADMDILCDDALIRCLHDFRDQGIVRAIGASTKTIEGGIRALELMDVVMCAYNPTYRDEEAVLAYAHKHNKAALIKKALASGHVSAFDAADPVQTAMDFAFGHKGTSGVIVGTINAIHLKDNVRKAVKAIDSAT